MVKLGKIVIEPPLINTSCAWASDHDELLALYKSPYTGAVTTRTATLEGFAEDSSHTVRLILSLCQYRGRTIDTLPLVGCICRWIVHQFIWLFALSACNIPRLGSRHYPGRSIFVETFHHQHHFIFSWHAFQHDRLHTGSARGVT